MDLLSLADKAALTYSSSWLYLETEGFHIRELCQPKNWHAKLEFLDKFWISTFAGKQLCVGCTRYHPKGGEAQTSEVELLAGLVIELKKDVFGWSCQSPFKTRTTTWPLGNWVCQLKMRNRSNNGQVMSKVIGLFFEQSLTLKLIHEASSVELPSCRHCPGRVKLRAQFDSFITNVPRPWQSHLDASELSSDIFRCSWCPSEFSFNIRPYNDAAEVDVNGATHVLQIIYAVDLGHCRTPHSRYWHALRSKSNSRIVPTDPFPLTTSNPVVWYALNCPLFHDRYKVVALTH